MRDRSKTRLYTSRPEHPREEELYVPVQLTRYRREPTRLRVAIALLLLQAAAIIAILVALFLPPVSDMKMEAVAGAVVAQLLVTAQVLRYLFR
jgi:hypothetical protein